MIRLRTLGEAVIEVDGDKYGPDFDVLFAGLVYLTAERGRQVPRAVLAELLWPRLAGNRARHNLRQLLYRMRMAGVSVDGTREHVLLPDHHVAPTFSAHPTPERLVAERGAGTLIIGSFLPGYDPRFSDPFAEWLERTRGTVEARVRRVLLEVAQAQKLRGEWAEVEALASECLRLDPLNEEATLARAEAIAMVGGKSEAVQILDRFIEDLGATSRSELKLPATVLRRRIAERFPARRYAGPSERCFVGRAALMEKLSTALLRARNGEGNGILLTGAPGIGKTRLVHELTRVGIMQGVRVVRVGVDESDLQRPMAAFVDAVPQLRALPGAIGVSPESLAFLDRLTEVHRPSDALPEEPRDPRWIAGRIRQAVVDLCDAVASEGTLLLVVEDVHWLDASSWASLAALLEWIRGKRAMLVLTSRGPHPTPTTPRRCVEQLPVHPVTALPHDAAVDLVRAIAADHGGPLSDEAVEWCVSVGEGNALFLRELAIHCLEGGAIHALPPSLKGLLDARISRLSPTGRRVLEAAAVLGDFASLDRLTPMLDIPAHLLAGSLSELSEALLLDDSATSVRLRHELVRARTIELIALPAARFLHDRAARSLALEASDGATAELLIAASAHWQEAGSDERAAAALLQAASVIQHVGGSRESIRVLLHARERASVSSLREEILRRLARGFAVDGQWDHVRDVSIELARLPRRHDDQCAADEILLIEAMYRSDEDPRPLMARVTELVNDRSLGVAVRLEAARCGTMIGSNIETTAELKELLKSASTVLDCHDVEPTQRMALQIIREAEFGDLKASLHLTKQLRAAALRDVDALRRVASLSVVADAFRSAGLSSEAKAALETLKREAHQIGSRYAELRAIHNLGGILLDMGDYAAGLDLLRQADALVDGLEAPWHFHVQLGNRARINLLAGDFETAERDAHAYFDSAIAARYPVFWFVREAATTLAEVQLVSMGQVDPEVLDVLRHVHVVAQARHTHDRTAAVLWLALDRRGQKREAEEMLSEYLSTHRRCLGPWRNPLELLGGMVPASP